MEVNIFQKPKIFLTFDIGLGKSSWLPTVGLDVGGLPVGLSVGPVGPVVGEVEGK